MNFGPIQIDISGLIEVLNTGRPSAIVWWLFIHGGFVLVLFLFYIFARFFWFNYRQGLYTSKWRFVLLAIDIPKNTEQTLKAVEHIFTSLSGTLANTKSFLDKYWYGTAQESYSFEIISIDGYIQFLVRTTVHYRDLVEAAIYAQYPDAEIAEVDDYTQNVPHIFPNEEYDLWGADLILANKSAYPIKTYPAFEHAMVQEFKDPLASLLEAMSKIGRGEQIWFQIVIAPTPDSWKAGEEKVIQKKLGMKIKEQRPPTDRAIEYIFKSMNNVSQFLYPIGSGVKKEADAPSLIQYMSPGQKNIIEAMEHKISKIGFKTKIRMIYTGEKDVFSKTRGVSPMMGAMQQFTALDMNAFKVHSKTKVKEGLIFKKSTKVDRQRKILRNYIKRSIGSGGSPFILNTEELATLYHFPSAAIKTPLLRRTTRKITEPPMDLPIGEGSRIEYDDLEKRLAAEISRRKDALSDVNIPLDSPKTNISTGSPENQNIGGSDAEFLRKSVAVFGNEDKKEKEPPTNLPV